MTIPLELMLPLAVICVICMFCAPKSVFILLPLILAVPLICSSVIELLEINCDSPAKTPLKDKLFSGASVKTRVEPLIVYDEFGS